MSLKSNLFLVVLFVSAFYGSSLTAYSIKKSSQTIRNHSRLHSTLASSKDDSSSLPKKPYQFCNYELDAKILNLALPAILNFAIVPLVGAVDTYWVGTIKMIIHNIK